LHDIYKDLDQKLEEVLKSLSVPTGSNGVAFAINGKITGADFFDKPETLAKLWPKLVKSYAIDVLEHPMEKPPALAPERITEWLKAATSPRQQWSDSRGVGKDVRIEGDELTGATLVVQTTPFTLSCPGKKPSHNNRDPSTHESTGPPRGFWKRLFS